MCLLTYYPDNVQPDTEALATGALWNRDGHGFAIVAGNRLIIDHDMRAEVMIERFAKVRAQYPDGPALFHSRWGTGGTRDERNCHPFRIAGDRRTVVAHNGVLPYSMQPPKGDLRSDTRFMAEEILSGWDIGDLTMRASLSRWIGYGNKLVFLTVNPAYARSAYIVNEYSGKWINGIWYSNPDYLDPWPTTMRTVGAVESANPEECWVCSSSEDVDVERVMCLACNICLDCGQDWDEACECYTLPDGTDERYAADLMYSGPATRGPDDIPAELDIIDVDPDDLPDDMVARYIAAAENYAQNH